MRNKVLELTGIFLGTLMFAACGDDSPSRAENDQPTGGSEVLCNKANEGEVIKPADSKYSRICRDGEWVIQETSSSSFVKSSSSEKFESCSSTEVSSSGSLEAQSSSSFSEEVSSSSSAEVSSSSSLEAQSSSSSSEEVSSSSSAEVSSSSSLLVQSSSSLLVQSSSSSSEEVSSSSSTEVSSSSSLLVQSSSSSSEEVSSSSSTEVSSSGSLEAQSSSSVLESSSSDFEEPEVSSSSEGEKLYLCDDGVTYVVDVKNCDKDLSSSSETVVSSSSELVSSSSSSEIVESSSSSLVPQSSSNSIVSSSSITPFDGDDSSLLDGNAMLLLDRRDGHLYKVTAFKGLVWMAENLNFAYNVSKFSVNSNGSGDSDSTSWCYNNDEKKCSFYGRLYTWSAAMDSAGYFKENVGTNCGYGKRCVTNTKHRGVCPSGWHLPTDSEWKTLAEVGSTSSTGYYMKAKRSWYGGGNGTDVAKFDARPAGLRISNGRFDYIDREADFWTSSDQSDNLGYSWGFTYSSDAIRHMNESKTSGRSVRCVKDNNYADGTLPPEFTSSNDVTFEGDDTSVYDAQSGTLTDNRDGQAYKTVTIGSQTWMAQNLNYAYVGAPYTHTYASDSSSWCYNNDPSNCDKYGRLYTWGAAMDSIGFFVENKGTECGHEMSCTAKNPQRGICPKGWHLPSYVEWNTLMSAIGNNTSTGSKLRSTEGWEKNNGTDELGFSVLPAGRLNGNIFIGLGDGTFFWTSFENGSFFYAYSVSVMSSTTNLDLMGTSKYYAGSLRCLMD